MLSNSLTVQSRNDWPKARKLIFVICLISFVFQLSRITAHYYRYETEFQTKLFNGNKEVLDLPAITLCAERDAIFLKSSLRKQFPEIDRYLERIDKSNDSSADKELRKNSVYVHYLERGLDIRKYFDRSIKASDFTECYLDPATKWMNQKKWNFMFTDCSGISPVLESRVSLFGRSSQAKCFTFFSRQQTEIKGETDLQIDMKELEDHSSILDLIVPMDQFEESLGISSFDNSMNSYQKSVFLFIHDSYGMPSFDTIDAIELKPGKRYEIRFWSTTKSLLKHPFPSNCLDYRKNLMIKELSKSMDQCVHDCYLEKSVQTLKCLVPQHILFNDYKLNAYNPKQCHQINDIIFSQKLAKQCRQMCHQDCHRTEYKFDYKETDHQKGLVITPLRRQTEKFSLVHLKYKKASDSEYRERPVQTMCATIQMMFIALLIWFGLSVFSFSSVFEMAVNKAKPHMYYISAFDDKVSPSVLQSGQELKIGQGHPDGWNGMGPQNVQTDQPMIKPRFTPTNIGSNVKLEHYNAFISKVVDGYPTAHTVELPQKKSFTQY